MTAKKDGVILVSFGSVAPAHAMPIAWKQAILDMARAYPTYQFIWKYEKDDLAEGKVQGARIPDNMHLSKWMPQTDILG